jgi:hypothetical protein
MKVESANAEPEQRDPHFGAFANPTKMAGCVHAHANLVLEFVPDCRLINANHR